MTSGSEPALGAHLFATCGRRDGLAPRLRWGLGAVLLGLCALQASRAAAQKEAGTPPSGPLPTIVYPSRANHPPPPDAGPPKVSPESEGAPDEDSPVRYVFVGGFWGFWDHHRHFHRVSARIAHALRVRAIAYRAPTFAPVSNFGHDRMHR